MIGLKKVLLITIFWFGCPINGIEFGLLVGAEDGDNVQKIKFVLFSVYLYLIAFCEVFVRFCTIGSQKNEDVIILKKLAILEPSVFKYSILNPTNP